MIGENMADNKNSSLKSQNNKNSETKPGKMRLRPVWAVIFAVLLILIIAALVKHFSGNDDSVNDANIDIIDLNADVQTIEDTRPAAQTVVKIDLQSCRITVGEKIYVTATVTPANTDKSLQWKSSDEKVFKVSPEGILEVVGVGTAALSATVGDVSDAIVIEGVESADSKSQLDLPGYDEVKDKEDDKAPTEPETARDSDGTQQETASYGQPEGQTGQTATQLPLAQTTQAATLPVTPSSAPQEESRGLRSQQLPEVLGNYGYSPSGDNVYAYGEGDSYSGEIIVQPNLVIIYIKNITPEYSRSIQNVLEELLPDEHEQAWNNYTSATTDRTFTLEGRKVRIVTAGNGGHSQIVVYN